MITICMVLIIFRGLLRVFIEKGPFYVFIELFMENLKSPFFYIEIIMLSFYVDMLKCMFCC